MNKRCLAGLMTHQYKKLPVTTKMWMQFNVMPRTSLGVDAVSDVMGMTLSNNFSVAYQLDINVLGP